jgi:hypothetical protein
MPVTAVRQSGLKDFSIDLGMQCGDSEPNFMQDTDLVDSLKSNDDVDLMLSCLPSEPCHDDDDNIFEIELEDVRYGIRRAS